VIAKEETLRRIRAQAAAYAEEHGDESFGDHWTLVDLLRETYLRGADAGYSAAKAEEREA
jgi:hypothetical protein